LPCSGNLELSAKCFQQLILKDQNHPAALVNYAALLLGKYASVVAGIFIALVLCSQFLWDITFLSHIFLNRCRLFHSIVLTFCYIILLMPGPGASASEGAMADQIMAAKVAKECLLAAIKADSKSAHLWANLAYAFSVSGDHRSSSKCLEKVLMAPCYSHL